MAYSHIQDPNQSPMIEIPEKLLSSDIFKSLTMKNLRLDKFNSLNQIFEIIFQNIESFEQIKALYQSDKRLGKFIEKNIVIFTDDIELPTRQMSEKDGIEGLNIDKFEFKEILSSPQLFNQIFHNPRYKFYLIYFNDSEIFQSISNNSKIWQVLQRSNKVQNAYLYNKLDISSTVKPTSTLYNISEETIPISSTPIVTTQFQLNKSPNRSRSNSRTKFEKSKICDIGPNIGTELNERQQMQQEACVIGFFIFVIGLMVFLISRG